MHVNYVLALPIFVSKDIQLRAFLDMMEEGFVVVAFAGILSSIASFLKKKIMVKVAVRKNIVRAVSKSVGEFIYHGLATIPIFATHLFILGDAI
jgi:hypothetical protein